MKTLSLYIDRWYIVASVNSDNVLSRLNLSNKEDRIWLYFYEDVSNGTILFGKRFKSKFLEKEPGYYGDIFTLMLKDDVTFKYFGKNLPIQDIFDASDIFDQLTAGFEQGEKISTYVSFSQDVQYASQKVFLDLLEEKGFKIEESVTRLSQLAVELTDKKGLLKNDKNILLISACNENLRYVVYSRIDGLFVRQQEEEVLNGYGNDLRGQALLEQIIWQVNNTSKFLEGEDIEFEFNRLSQNLEEWLLKLDKKTNGMPIVYRNVIFSVAPYNPQNVPILKKDVEERTKTIVEDIVKNIKKYVSESGVNEHDITHIIFIGNTFSNEMYKEILLHEFPVGPSNIITYQDRDIPEIIGIYNQINLSQFDKERADVQKLSEGKLRQIKQQEQEEKERQKAQAEQEKIEKAKAEIRKSEKEYKVAISNADKCVSEGDLNGALDYLQIILTIKPDDEYALNLKEELTNRISENKVRNEQYNKLIKQAQDAFKTGCWQEALTKSESALELSPSSEAAAQIKNEAFSKIQIAATVKEFMLRGEMFFGQKLYSQALQEMEKAQLTDPENEEIKNRILEVESIMSKSKDELDSKKLLLKEAEADNDYKKAIQICNELLDIDVQNQRSWTERIIIFKEELKKQEVENKHFSFLSNQIKEAFFAKKWEKVIDLSHQALLIREDDDILGFLKNADRELKDEIERRDYKEKVDSINQLIAEHFYSEARRKTQELKKEYPSREKEIGAISTAIWEAEDKFKSSSHVKTHSTDGHTFGSAEHSSAKDGDDFFSKSASFSRTQNTRHSTRSETQKPVTSRGTAEKKDDFFDMPVKDRKTNNPKKEEPRNKKLKSSTDDFFGDAFVKPKPKKKDDFFD